MSGRLEEFGRIVRDMARQSIRQSPEKATPGQPPHTRGGALPAAIDYAPIPGRGRVVIGTRHSRVKRIGATLERGLVERGRWYHKFPFMGPALARAAARMPRLFENLFARRGGALAMPRRKA